MVSSKGQETDRIWGMPLSLKVHRNTARMMPWLAPVITDMRQAGNALNWSVAEWQAYIAWMNAKYGTRVASSNNGLFLFAQPVVEWVEGDAERLDDSGGVVLLLPMASNAAASVSSASSTIHSTTERHTRPTTLRRCAISASRPGVLAVSIVRDRFAGRQMARVMSSCRLVPWGCFAASAGSCVRKEQPAGRAHLMLVL